MNEMKHFALTGTASATGYIIDNDAMPNCGNITPASATEGDAGVFTLLEQPFCSRYFVYFCSDKWYGWKCGLHDY
jgi:hypothetical protein